MNKKKTGGVVTVRSLVNNQLEGGEIGVNYLVIAILVTGELNDTAHDRHGTWVV